MDTVSPEQVRAQVQKFWRILSGKSGDNLDQLYAADAVVITGKAKRTEPARLAIARRLRQLSAQDPESRAELADIDVQVVGNVAVASYTYQFHDVRKTNDGTRLERNTRYGRATQVFQLDDKQGLKIVHEHLSAGEAPQMEPRK